MVEKVHVDKNRMNSIRNTMQESSSPNASLLGRHDEGIRGGVFNEILANLKNLNVSHLIESQIQSIRPWLDDFFCSDAFETPKDGYPEIKRRLQINIQYYLSNYLAIGSILFLYIV